MTTTLSQHQSTKGSLRTPLLLLILFISLFRAYFLSISSIDLFVDEIQYWWWSLEMDWGFYSKPPMIAALIYLVTSLLGHSVFTIKLGAILIYPITTYIIYLLGQRLISERVGFWSAVIFITLPGVALSSTITSTDVLLFLFWSSAMLLFIRSIDSDSWFDWLLCGVICGLGLLTKYNMAIFSLSALGYMLFFGHAKQLANPRLWVMAAVALLILAPNFYWNYQHDFPTFSHTAEYVDKQGLYPNKMLNFLLEQAAIVGPVGFIVMWWWMFKGEQPRNLLLTFSLPMLVIISLVALQGKYNANWAAPTYVGISIGLAHFLQHRKRWMIALLVTNVTLGLVVQLADPILQATGTQLQAKQDPFKRVRGWKQWGADLKGYTDQYPDAYFIADGRNAITEAVFYTFGQPNERIFAWSPGPNIKSHFQLTRPFTETDGDRPALMLTRKSRAELDQYFAEITPLAIIPRVMGPEKQDEYNLYEVKKFLGYHP